MAVVDYNVDEGQVRFGDTTMTKVFIGGLAWETPKEVMRDHFAKFGEILEAVIIFDKVTGRSKGYGFVTFKVPEAAKRACEDPTPVINGRRANCNLAVLGARNSRQSSTPLPHQPAGIVSNGREKLPPPGLPQPPLSHLRWYYNTAVATSPAASPFHHNHHQFFPCYGFRYSPAYIGANVGYHHTLQNMSYNGGAYMNGHYIHQVCGGGAGGGQAGVNMMGGGAGPGESTLMPVYPIYHYHHHHHSQAAAAAAALGLPAPAVFPPAITTTPPPISISKPTNVSPPPPTAVGAVGSTAQKA